MVAAMGAILVVSLHLPIPNGQRRAKVRGGDIVRIRDSDWSNRLTKQWNIMNAMVMMEMLV